MKMFFKEIEVFKQTPGGERKAIKKVPRIRRIVTVVFIFLFLGWLIPSSIITVPVGHVKVGALFGKVQDKVISEGFHFVNPLSVWTKFDCRQKTVDQPKTPMQSSGDQLTTNIDWSIQYRADCSLAPRMLKTTGDVNAVVSVHLIPNFRSIAREKGKSVEQAEDFFSEEKQTFIQDAILADLAEVVGPLGINISAVLLRKVDLPAVVKTSIESKKVRQQEAAKEQAELDRFKIEQQKKVAQAAAEKDAALAQAESITTLAEANASANRKLAASITPTLVQYEATQVERMRVEVEKQAVEKWNGTLPTTTGGALPFIGLKSGGSVN